MESSLIVVIIITLVFSAFFSGMEIAFISSNRLKVELDRTKGTFNGKILGLFYKNESRFIAMLLLGNNIALVLFGIYAAHLLEPIIEGWGILDSALTLLIQTVLSTMLVLITAEFLPKTFVQINPNFFMSIAAVPILLIYILLYIPTTIILAISNVFLRLLKSNGEVEQKVFSKVDLEHYVQDINERIHEEEDLGNEMQILQNALDFSSVKARDCMVPRTELFAVDLNDSIESLLHLFVETGKSKILVYRDSIDNIIGYVHSFEMFKRPKKIKQILLPIPFVPSAIPGKELLELFAKQSGNIAVVVDEYGGTAGLITIEDVIEEIFGEIEDEHDTEDLLVKKINETEYLFSARAEIEFLNDSFNFNLPESDEYDTLGGLVLFNTEAIPEEKTVVRLESYTITVKEVSNNKIETVRVVIH